MGAAGRVMALVVAPFPPLRPALVLLNRRLCSIPCSPLWLLGVSSSHHSAPRPIHLVKCFHSQPNNNSQPLHSSIAAQQHPWPEWTQFLNVLSNGQGFAVPGDYGIPPEDAFVVYEKLPDDFVRAAASCITFSRARPELLRMLSRRDIEEVVSNGTPFLFKSAIDTSRRMKAFLGADASNVTDSGAASTVDIMKYILSYARNPTVSSERNGLFSRQLVDSSVRHLLHELAMLTTGVSYGNLPAPGQQLSETGATSNPYRPYIQMKRGDWICPKCNFMNFARNMKCLECEESRPKRLLVGSEWECLHCNFYNYGRNTVCLRCDHGRPSAPSLNNAQSSSVSTGNRFFNSSSDNQLASHGSNLNLGIASAASLNSSNVISEQNNGTGMPHSLPQGGYSGFQYGGSSQFNRVPNVAPSSDESEKQAPFRRAMPSDSSDQINQAEKSERWFKKISELHHLKDASDAVSDESFPEIMPMRKGDNQFVASKTNNRSISSPKYKRPATTDQANNGNYVPFVPFPPGYFARKDSVQSNSQDSNTLQVEDNGSSEATHALSNPTVLQPTSDISSKDGSATGISSLEPPRSEIFTSGWTGPSLEGSAVTETDPLDMSEEAKSERWFKRVAQIKDISELSQIPDEDFPSIMPMRKGVNRFVVSKRKTPLERRLTSQQYRRNLPVVTNEDILKKRSENN